MHPLDRVFYLGQQIEDAIDAENWLKLSQLVEQRSKILHRLEEMDDECVGLGLSPEEEDERAGALVEQQDRLLKRLREERRDLENEFEEFDEEKDRSGKRRQTARPTPGDG